LKAGSATLDAIESQDGWPCEGQILAKPELEKGLGGSDAPWSLPGRVLDLIDPRSESVVPHHHYL
jgi:hypothetical protein